MNTKKTYELLERFSFIPRANPLYPSDSCMPMSFDCGDGWFNLLWKLCEDIEAILSKPENNRLKENFVVDQVKEKFAGLRFYVSLLDGGIDELITKAERDSYHICEVCGEEGKTRDGGWYRTLCDKHAKERGQEKLLEMSRSPKTFRKGLNGVKDEVKSLTDESMIWSNKHGKTSK